MAEAAALSLDGAAATDDLGHYRSQVERIFNRISLTGLPERDPGLSELPLDHVFISLTVEVRPAIPSVRHPIDRETAGENPSLELEPSGELRAVPGSASFKRSAPELLKLSLGEALRRYRRLVIMGDPGSGKTTLLRWLAVTFAAQRQADPDRLGPTFSEPRLPVLLELRRFAERLRTLAEQPAAFDLADEMSSYVAHDARFARVPQEAIRAAIAAGSCLILLDGLDEIEDRQARTRLVEAIEALYRIRNRRTIYVCSRHGPMASPILLSAPSFKLRRSGPLAVMTSPPSSAIGIASRMESMRSSTRRRSWWMQSTRTSGSWHYRRTRSYAPLLLLYFVIIGFCRTAVSNFISNVVRRCSTPGNATKT